MLKQAVTLAEATASALLTLIICALVFAALAQGSHDALVALISLVTGAGVGVVAAHREQP